MGKIALWFCDLCGDEKRCASWPLDWGKLIDKERGDAGEKVEYMVCDECREDFSVWVSEVKE